MHPVLAVALSWCVTSWIVGLWSCWCAWQVDDEVRDWWDETPVGCIAGHLIILIWMPILLPWVIADLLKGKF